MAGVDTLSTLNFRSLSNIGAQLFEYAHLECSVQFARLMCTSRLGVVYSYCMLAPYRPSETITSIA